jgi:Cu/Ag efflux pump CusA
MVERLINVSHRQRLLVCLAGLVLTDSGLYAFRHVVC